MLGQMVGVITLFSACVCFHPGRSGHLAAHVGQMVRTTWDNPDQGSAEVRRAEDHSDSCPNPCPNGRRCKLVFLQVLTSAADHSAIRTRWVSGIPSTRLRGRVAEESLVETLTAGGEAVDVGHVCPLSVLECGGGFAPPLWFLTFVSLPPASRFTERKKKQAKPKRRSKATAALLFGIPAQSRWRRSGCLASKPNPTSRCDVQLTDLTQQSARRGSQDDRDHPPYAVLLRGQIRRPSQAAP